MIVRFRAKGNEGLLVSLLRKMGVALGDYIRKKREEKVEKEKTLLWKKRTSREQRETGKTNCGKTGKTRRP